MAQAKQDLQAIINAAAEKEGLDPELLQKIGGAESGLRAGAKNPKSTAKGLFQFVDKTWAEMGGKPGEQYNPQKNAELGARYVKRNMDMLTQTLGREPSYGEVYAAHFFGPTGAKALLTKADPNAPIEQSLQLFESPKRVQKVLKQNPNLKGKTTAQVLADLDAKMGSKKPVVQETPTATTPTAPAKPKMEMFRRPVPRFIRSEAPNLGTGYNAALALMGMTEMGEDQDPLAKAQETVAQAEEENSVADYGQAQKMLAQVQAPNAFANRQMAQQQPQPGQAQQPLLMARGGAVKKSEEPQQGGGFFVPTQRHIYRAEDKAYLDEQLAAWNKYNEEANTYNQKLAEYQGSEPVKQYATAAEAYNAKLREYEQNVYNPYRTKVDEYNAKLEAFNNSPEYQAYRKQVEDYNAALTKYQEEVYNPYKAQVEAYNTGLEQFQQSDPYKQYTTAAEEYNKKVEAYNAAPTQTYRDKYGYRYIPRLDAYGSSETMRYSGQQYGPKPVSGPFVGSYVNDGSGRGDTAFRLAPGYQFSDGTVYGKSVPLPGEFTMKAPEYTAPKPTDPTPFGMAQPTEVKFGYTEPTKPADFTMAPPTAPAGFGVPLPTQPTESIDTVMARRAKADAIAAKDAEQRGLAINVANNPNQFNLAGFGSAGINAPSLSMFAKGGEVEAKPEPEPEKGSAKAMLKEVARSTQYLPADIAGAPVDLINLGLQGVDALTGSKLAQKMPVGGAEWLIDKANKYGLMDKPTGSMTETLTRLGTGVLSPTAGPKAAVAAGKAIKGTAKAALEDLAMAGTGQGGSKVAQSIAKATGMEPSFAVRPKGGVSLGAASAADVPLTRIDESLQRVIGDIDTETEQGKAVANFFDKKMRNFYQQQYGTADDPLFKAILEGRIQPPIASPQVIDAARAGDPKALKNLREAYDASTNVQALGSRKILDKMGKHPYDMEGDVRKLIKAQSPNEPTLMVSATGLNPRELEAYPMMYGPKGFKDIVAEGEAGDLLRLFNQTDLPPHVRQAVAKGEPIYGTTGGTSRMMPLGDIRDYLMTRTPAEIKNMGVADVAAKSQEWHRRMAEARKSPDKFSSKELFQGTAPVLDVDKYKWVDVKTPDALSLEGNIMGHCVGGSNYCNAVSKETTKIVSLRDKKGVPHVTIQLDKTPDGFTRVAQIKGTGNTSPEKYFNEVNAFLEDYSSKLGGNLTITERPSFVPPQWREK
jgi:hypothetical protein